MLFPLLLLPDPKLANKSDIESELSKRIEDMRILTLYVNKLKISHTRVAVSLLRQVGTRQAAQFQAIVALLLQHGVYALD